MTFRSAVVASIAAMLSVASTAFAQDPRGALRGRVTALAGWPALLNRK